MVAVEPGWAAEVEAVHAWVGVGVTGPSMAGAGHPPAGHLQTTCQTDHHPDPVI